MVGGLAASPFLRAASHRAGAPFPPDKLLDGADLLLARVNSQVEGQLPSSGLADATAFAGSSGDRWRRASCFPAALPELLSERVRRPLWLLKPGAEGSPSSCPPPLASSMSRTAEPSTHRVGPASHSQAQGTYGGGRLAFLPLYPSRSASASAMRGRRAPRGAGVSLGAQPQRVVSGLQHSSFSVGAQQVARCSAVQHGSGLLSVTVSH
jgi:hypothetical protein